MGCEVGVREGRNAEAICNIVQGIKLFGVDSWPDRKFYDSMLRRLGDYIEDGIFVPVQKTSMDAVGDFEDGSLDFVYIDADHSCEAVLRDIVEWSKKVRNGGFVSGHDYFEKEGFGVVRAVDIKAKEYNKELFVLADEGQKNTKNTWFWIK